MVSPFDANGKVRLKFTTVLLLLAVLLCEELEKHCGGKAAKMRREKFSNCTFETLRLSSESRTRDLVYHNSSIKQPHES